MRSKKLNIALDKDLEAFLRKSTSIVVSICIFLCWIHFCCMPSCKLHRFSTNRKIQNGCHWTSAIHILSLLNTISWFGAPDIRKYIWDALFWWRLLMTTINGTRYLIERSWVQAPLEVCYPPRQKIETVSFHGHSFLNLYRHIYRYVYIDKNVFKTTRSFCYQWFRVSTLQANATKHGKINFKPMNRS